MLAGTTLRPHPSADLHFRVNLAARAKPFAPDGHDGDESDPEAFARQMRREAYIATSQLKLRIALARRKAGRQAIRLSEVLDPFPLKYGLLELNAFIELAVPHMPSSFDAQRVSATRLIDARAQGELVLDRNIAAPGARSDAGIADPGEYSTSSTVVLKPTIGGAD